jgi:hypothetical protein
MKKTFAGFSIGISLICIGIIIVLASGKWKRFVDPKVQEPLRTKIISPAEPVSRDGGLTELTVIEEKENTKVAMESGELVIAVLNQDGENTLSDEQIIAFRRGDEIDGHIFLSYIKFDENYREYRRIWNAATAASRAETLSLFSQDIIGDRDSCIIVTGMNSRNEHTITVFRPNKTSQDTPFTKIAELAVDGSIIIQEISRSLAYQQGIARGLSYAIISYSHDPSSANILDQLETIYNFNPESQKYEMGKITKIPGSQIEQRKLRELLSGTSGVFENFINDLWYYVSPQGTIDSKQYLYFNPSAKEIIFYAEETQQIFQWINSSPKRYGLYIRSNNISITTLQRFIDIELESLDSIRLHVFEDVNLKINVSASWDGSYRRAAAVRNVANSSIKPTINALYDSVFGRIQFLLSGDYSITSEGTVSNGRYIFFRVDNHDLLELRNEAQSENRLVYRVDSSNHSNIILSRVRLGSSGVQDMLETQVHLIPVFDY